MTRFAADENFDGDILRGLLRRDASIEVVRVQDVGHSGHDDPTILDWAAREGRALLTHDVTTMTRYAYDRIRDGLPMSGVLVIHPSQPIARLIDDLLLIATCSLPSEWDGQVRYLPLD